jgi:hypothetical protein
VSGKGGKPPAAPDYIGAAREQGRQNLEAIRAGAALNRVNQVNPFGSTTYTQDPNNPDRYTQTTTLSPNQQRILEQGEGNQIDLGRIANMRLGQVGEQGAFTLDGLPQQVTSVTPSKFNTDINAQSVRYRDLDTSSLPGFGKAGVQRSLDFSGAPNRADARYQQSVDLSRLSQLPGNGDFSGERQRVEDSVYGRAAGRLDEQFGKREDALRTQLINQGVREGSEAYNNAMRDLQFERQDAYGDARDRAILAGGQEQSRLFGDALRGRQQGASEQFGLGEFANNAADRANQYGLAARGQAVGETQAAGQFANSAAEQVNSRADAQRAQRLAEILSRGQFGNQAAQQEFANELSRTGLVNDVAGKQFSQNLTNAQLQNEGRATGINERLTERDAPLREFLSLYGGGYSSPFQAPGVAQAGTPQAGDVQGAVGQQYGAQADLYNWQQSRNAQNVNSLLQLAALFAQ